MKLPQKFALLTLSICWSMSVFAAQKVALIIGNSQYANVSESLRNPVNDANAIAKRLRELGFDTELVKNATLDNMLDALDRVKSRVDTDGTIFFYYAGHGVQLNGSNYLVPVDARLASKDKVAREAILVKEVIEKLSENGAAARIVVLDACRNDPFPKTYRAATRGLAREMPVNRRGLLVFYAASEGEVAEDGVANNGTFTAALLQGLQQKGKELPKLVDDVALQVQQQTGHRQNPYSEGMGLSSLVLVPGTPESVKPSIENPQAAEIAYWNSIKNSTNTNVFQSYLNKYPNGLFVELAQAKLQPKGVITTASGLQYEVLVEGMGKKPQATDIVEVHYEGKFTNGSIFDSSIARGKSNSFRLDQVIQGWTEGVQLMKEGSKYRFTIPPSLAYGESGMNIIPPNAVLVFEVELLKVIKSEK